ncbi:hypothetical protein [Deinococcus sp. Leaf326]|uniref:hypothetical protein n=1 Tax=Deinococcus sp. Leaf326 TaxID=1736338 RepID=UPI0007002974|nr:hypothetical protein [Deinococcus sp. Leaf326]KQR22869.1 hypothetical protein ASF71_06800 [Deinococcus sp. Leaf326]
MATLPIKSILQHTEYSQHHGLLGKQAAGASFKLGNLISPDANGDYVETAVGAGAATARNKLAAQDSGMRVDLKIPYVDPNGTMIFEVTATGAAATAALIKPGVTYGLGKDATTGFHTVLLTDTTNAVFRTVAVNGTTLARGAVGDTNVGLFVQLLAR